MNSLNDKIVITNDSKKHKYNLSKINKILMNVESLYSTENIMSKVNRIFICDDIPSLDNILEYFKIDNFDISDYENEIEYHISDSSCKGLCFTLHGYIFIRMDVIIDSYFHWENNSLIYLDSSFSDYNIFGKNENLAYNGIFWNTLLHEIYHIDEYLNGIDYDKSSCEKATIFARNIFEIFLKNKHYEVYNI